MRVIGIVGWKNNGKTTLVVKLVKHLTEKGLRVSTLKHAHHTVDVDRPGKDSFLHRQAGASEVLLATSRRWALMHELRHEEEPGLEWLLSRLSPCDLVVVEGFKSFDHPKIEVHLAARGTPLIAETDETVIAVATDAELALSLPTLPIDDVAAIAELALSVAGEM